MKVSRKEPVNEELEVLREGTEMVQRLCESGAHGKDGLVATHSKEILDDAWVRYVCSSCGQVKFVLRRLRSRVD